MLIAVAVAAVRFHNSVQSLSSLTFTESFLFQARPSYNTNFNPESKILTEMWSKAKIDDRSEAAVARLHSFCTITNQMHEAFVDLSFFNDIKNSHTSHGHTAAVIKAIPQEPPPHPSPLHSPSQLAS